MASTADADNPTGSHRVVRAIARWLPVPIAVLVGVAALSVVSERAPTPLGIPAVAPPELATPIVAITRLPPAVFTDAIAAVHRQERADQLALFALSQPPDTCLVVDDDEGRLLDHRGDDPQVPASAQKLVLATAVLLALDPDERLTTSLRHTGEIVDGVLRGDLYVVGGGDPLLATATYAARFRSQPQTFTDIGEVAAVLAAAGITRIEGDIVGDGSRYDAVRYHEAWPPRFVTQNQTGPLSALHVNDGFASFPAEGSVPVVPAADPAANAAQVVRTVLSEAGIEVAGGARSGVTPPDLPELGVVASAPLADVVSQTLADSDNNTAELLLKELGFRLAGAGTSAAGATIATQVLTDAGLPVGVVVDGSGLAGSNVVTCDGLATLLAHEPVADQLAAGLAVAGESGTLRFRWLDTELVGRIRAKTGTLNQVTALVGYATGLDGVERRFALVVNVEEPAIIQRETVVAQQRLAELLVAPPPPIDESPFRP